MEKPGMKSAFERAWEKAERIQASEDKVQALEYEPQGAKMAAKYLEDMNYDLVAAFSPFDSKVRKHVVNGAVSTFLGNIILPRGEVSKQRIRRALDGVFVAKGSKSKMNIAARRLDDMFKQYEQMRTQAYEGLKRDFEAAVSRAMQEQRPIGQQPKINVEAVPEFQQKWREQLTQIDLRFEQMLRQLKEEMTRATG